ncbi:MAG: hypothetical protein RI885_895 [Actinomycetota bacterium]|jgi:hypothetical protein
MRSSYYRNVTSASDALALVLELVTYIALAPGIVLLVVGYTRRAFASRYQHTWGVVVDSPAGTTHPWFRWLDLDREFQSAPVSGDTGRTLAVGDEVEVYFDPRNPENARLTDPTRDGHLVRMLGWILTGVGTAAGIGQLIALVVTG